MGDHIDKANVSMNTTESYLQMSNTNLIKSLNHEETIRRIPVMVYLCLIMITGVLGNGHVCYIYQPKQARDPSNPRRFVFFLGVIDLFSAGIITPIDIVSLFFQYDFDNDFLCKISAFFILWPTLCMAFTIVAVAVERHRTICKPKGWQVNLRREKQICKFIISFSFVCALGLPVFNARTIVYELVPGYNITSPKCTYPSSEAGPDSLKFWYIVGGVTLFISCIVTTLVLNFLIGVELFRQSNVEELPDDVYNDPSYPVIHEYVERAITEIRLDEKARKASKGMVIVCIAYVLSYLPFMVLMIIRTVDKDFETDLTGSGKLAYMFLINSYQLNYAINPFVYWFTDTNFKDKCKTILPGMWRECWNK